MNLENTVFNFQSVTKTSFYFGAVGTIVEIGGYKLDR